MKRSVLFLCLIAVSAFAVDFNIVDVLNGVEHRYNHAKTLKVVFHESYTAPQRPRQTESGTLLLRKPGRMRWVYSSPPGKLFVSDGKYAFLYTPSNNQVEKTKMKESDDMRAPLAFLLGKLHFTKEFKDIVAKRDGSDILISAKPKQDDLPYTSVQFWIRPDYSIHRLKVTEFDRSELDFVFEDEKVNPQLEANLFRFQIPSGAELIESSQ